MALLALDLQRILMQMLKVGALIRTQRRAGRCESRHQDGAVGENWLAKGVLWGAVEAPELVECT